MARRYQAYNRTDRRPDKALMPPSGNALWRILRAIAEIRKAAMPLNPAPHDGVFRAQLFKLIAVRR